MTKRQRIKIIKKYSDKWWDWQEDEKRIYYFLNPPPKWNNAKMIKEFHRQHRDSSGIYNHKISF